jgi:hypothetical protein
MRQKKFFAMFLNVLVINGLNINNNNNNNKLQLGFHPVAVVILHVHKFEISN